MKGKLFFIVLAIAAVAYISAAYAQQNSSTLNLVNVQNNLAADANKAPGQEPNQEPNQAPDKGKKPDKKNLCSADLKKDADKDKGCDANKPGEPNKPAEPNKATVLRLSDFSTYGEKPKGGEKEPNKVEPNKPAEPNKADLCSADLKKDADANKPAEPNKPVEPNDKK